MNYNSPRIRNAPPVAFPKSSLGSTAGRIYGAPPAPLSKKGEYLTKNEIDFFLGKENNLIFRKVYFQNTYFEINDFLLKLHRFLNNTFYGTTHSHMIAGGSLVRSKWGYSNEGDIDLYFNSLESMTAHIDVLSRNGYHVTSYDIDVLDKAPETIKFVQMKRDTSSGFFTTESEGSNRSLQLIKMSWFNLPEDILLSFDLSCCSIGLMDDTIYTTDLSLHDLMNKQFFVRRVPDFASTCKRIKKYIDRDFVLRCGTETDDVVKIFGGSALVSDLAIEKAIEADQPQHEIMQDTDVPDWTNPQYRHDYYNLDPFIFKKKWENG